MGSIWLENRNRSLLIIICIWTIVATILLSGSIVPPNRYAILALVWLLIVPVSYRILAEHETIPTGPLILPGIPTGSRWQPKTPRHRNPKAISRRERSSRDLNRLLKTLGYSSDSPENSDVDIIARAPDGRNLVFKLLDGEAGVLACQDTMKAMIENGVREAVVLAPQGSTSLARRFVRKIRSRKGLHIRIYNDTESINFHAGNQPGNPGKN